MVLPPHRLWRAWDGTSPPDDEDREHPWRTLAADGVQVIRIDPGTAPRNPLARRHPLLAAIDPLRAFCVLASVRANDTLVCFFEGAALLPALLRPLLARRARLVVIDVGDPDAWRLRAFLQSLVLPRADAVLVFSAHQSGLLARRFPSAPVPPPVRAPVDCRFFAPPPPSGEDDHPSGPVLAIGDDVSRDWPTLLAAAPSIPHRIALRTRTLPPGAMLPPNVEHLSDPLDPPRYRDLIARAAIVVLPLHPGRHPGGVSALVQAMACARPLVVTRTDALAEYVEHEHTALLVPPHDPAALAAAIRRLLGDPGLQNRLGQAAREAALAHCSLDAWTATLRQVLAPRPSAHVA